MTDKISLYYTSGSPPSRACIQLARILKIDIDLKNVNVVKGEQHSEWFKQLNLVKKIPVMLYNGFVLAESRAILTYLINKWQPSSSWYPNDPEKRAIIDQRLYFDATIVFPSLAGVVVSVFILIRLF
jgi:glutathione S-transferase